METSIFVTDLAQQFSISLVCSFLSGLPEQAGANFLILGPSFPAGARSAPRRRKGPTHESSRQILPITLGRLGSKFVEQANTA